MIDVVDCKNAKCDWSGTIDEAGRKNFYFVYCPDCGDESPIPPKEILAYSLS